MKNKQLRSLAFATLCLASAFALAVTSKPCESSSPTTCTGAGNGAQCGGEGSGGVVVISDPQPFAYYYCGGNSPTRCTGGTSGQCSELLYKTGMAQHIQCMAGSTVLHDYGWCFTSLDSNPPTQTGYDCGNTPCPDVPPGDRIPPNIVGVTAPCTLTIGTYILTQDCEQRQK